MGQIRRGIVSAAKTQAGGMIRSGIVSAQKAAASSAALTMTLNTTGETWTTQFEIRVTEDVVINWGDGTTTNRAGGAGGRIGHTFASGSWTITVSGDKTNIAYLYLVSLPNLTVQAGEIGGLTSLTYLYFYDLPNLTVQAGEIGGLTKLTSLGLRTLSNCALQNLSTLTKATYITYQNSLSSADVGTVLGSLWSGFTSRIATGGTITIATPNAAPLGTYQAANPPTTGKEYAYELLNDSQNVNPTKKWATITVTGGLP